MTKEEAIERIKRVKGLYAYESDYEALDMAIEALKRDDPEVEFQKRFEASTFCGYSSNELLLFADACRRQGITEDQLHSFLTDTESALNYVMEKINEMFDEEIERQLS